MDTTPVLYKRTSAGAVQTWHAEIDGILYRSVSGQIGGQKVESGWQAAEAKNVGRSNETTPEQQARLELDAKIVKKLAQGGYHESIDDIDKPKFFKPMLAQNYNDRPIDWSGTTKVYCQPKLDGVRCIATIDGLWTRQGKPIEAVPHISVALAPFFHEVPDAILDGELYADKFADDFNEIISLVRKKNPSKDHFVKTAEAIQYHIYDCPSADGSFRDRITFAYREIQTLDGGCLQLVETALVPDQKDLDRRYGGYAEAGYEGQIVRLDLPYENKRSKSLLKRKEFLDDEFTVVAVTEGKGNRSGIAGFITYSLPDGRTFGSGIKGSHGYCRDLLVGAENYVGGTGTVRFFNYTPDGIPRFPVTVALFKGERDT